MIRKYVKLIIILALILILSSQHALAQTSFSFLTGEVLIKVRENVRIEDARVALETYGIEYVRPRSIPRLLKFKIPASSDLRSVLGQIQSLPFVEYAEPNFISFDCFTWDPNDQYYNPASGIGQWSLRSDYSHSIDANLAWDKVKGAGQKIAILDAGINGHADFDNWNKISKQFDWADHSDYYDPDEPPVIGYGVDPSTQRYIIRATGDYPDTDNVAVAEHWHGHQVAGTAAAYTDNEYGIAGVAPDASLIIARVTATWHKTYQTRETEEDPWEDQYCTGDYANGILYDDLADAIWWATDTAGADVINMSIKLIAPFPIEGSAIQTAINHAVEPPRVFRRLRYVSPATRTVSS